MAAITAKDVAALRAKTGIGMMECKKALVEADGDMDAAVKILREKGELKAESKMATRIAADGLVEILKDGDLTAMIEVNSETDFVAKNETFKAFVTDLLKIIIAQKPATVEALMACKYDDEMTVDAKLKEMIFKIGEKLTVRRFVLVEGITSTYIHGNGSIGVVAKFKTNVADKPEFAAFAKNIALQIGAYPTPYLCREQVPADVIEKEKEILLAQIKNDEKLANKPAQVIDKMVEGKVKKYYEENCLLNQAFVKDPSVTVGALLKKENSTVLRFTRYEMGEGLEKKTNDFAAEVEAQMKK